jgi:iron complex transport system ATP-binding protein
MTLLDVHQLDAYYGTRPALTGVSVSVNAGEIVGVVGPNGAGKSTLLRIASGVLAPSRGRVEVLGESVETLSLRERARRIAVVTQLGTVPGAFTASQLVGLGRTPHLGLFRPESAHDHAVIRAAMEATATWEWRDRRVGQLSGGERQRVLLARMLAQQAPLLLLDEPTNHLDLRAQAELFAILSALVVHGDHGVLLAVHDLTLAAQHCDRLLLLCGGRMVATGGVWETLTPTHLEAAYGVTFEVMAHPATGRPLVLPGAKLAESIHPAGS